MGYFGALTEAMTALGQREEVIFVGQAVGAGGTSMNGSFDGVPREKRLEFPVAENLQMGFCTGLALQGKLPIAVYPRWNFLISATDQLVNHLDRLPLYSGGGYKPRVIIRVAAPVTAPFYPGPQHDDDFSYAFRFMLRTVKIVDLEDEDAIKYAYEDAADADHSTILVEHVALYGKTR